MGLFDSFVGKDRALSDLRKYIDDFELVEITDAKGRRRQRAVYRGTWHVLRERTPAVLIRLWGMLGLAVTVAAVYVWLMTLRHLAGTHYLVMVPLLIGLLPCLYLVMGALSLPFRGRPMRRDQYMHSLIRVARSAAAVGVCVAVGLAASFVYRAMIGDWLFLPADWLFVGLCAAMLVCCLAILGLQRSIDLAERENGFYQPETR